MRGGWTLDVHHVYDPIGRVLYQGDGHRLTADSVSSTIVRIAGVPQVGSGSDVGENVPAIQAQISKPRSVAPAPDGSYYVGLNNKVVKVGTDGILHTVVGPGTSCPPTLGDGGFGTAACVRPEELVVDAYPFGEHRS